MHIYANDLVTERAYQAKLAKNAKDRGEQLQKMRNRIARSESFQTVAKIAVVTAEREDPILAPEAAAKLERLFGVTVDSVTVKDSHRLPYNDRVNEYRGLTRDEAKAQAMASLPVKAQEVRAPREGEGEPTV